MGDRRGFGVVMAISVLVAATSLALVLAMLLDVTGSAADRTVERETVYYLAEGIIERGLAEHLAPNPDWTTLVGDTLYADVAMDRGTCTMTASNPTIDSVDLTAEAWYGDTHGILRLQVERIGASLYRRRLLDPYVETREE